MVTSIKDIIIPLFRVLAHKLAYERQHAHVGSVTC